MSNRKLDLAPKCKSLEMLLHKMHIMKCATRPICTWRVDPTAHSHVPMHTYYIQLAQGGDLGFLHLGSEMKSWAHNLGSFNFKTSSFNPPN